MDIILKDLIRLTGRESKDLDSKLATALVAGNFKKSLGIITDFEGPIPYSSFNEDWQTWKRSFWKNLCSLDISSDGQDPGTHLMLCLQMLEGEIKGINKSDREKWRKKCKKQTHPFLALKCSVSYLTDHVEELIGISIDEYARKAKSCVSTLRDAADKLDEITSNCGTAQTIGGGVGIASGVLTIGGLLLAPFTAGLSLTATAVGAVTGVAAGITSLSAALVQRGWDKKKIEQCQKETDQIAAYTFKLFELLAIYQTAVKEAKEFLESHDGAEFKRAIINNNEDEFWRLVLSLKEGAQQVMGVYGAYKSVEGSIRLFQLAQTLTAGIAREVGRDIAEFHAIPGFVFRIPGLSIPAAATLGRAVTSIAGVLGIGFGIWDVIDGIEKINDGSVIAKKFRDQARNQEKTSKEMVAAVREIEAIPDKR